MRISDWSSDVCSSDLSAAPVSSMRFVDRINAVGTALANEQVVISAPVTERVVSLNFADGGYVRQGQVIATMAHSAEQAQLAAATAQQRRDGRQQDGIRTPKERGFATKRSITDQC